MIFTNPYRVGGRENPSGKLSFSLLTGRGLAGFFSLHWRQNNSQKCH